MKWLVALLLVLTCSTPAVQSNVRLTIHYHRVIATGYTTGRESCGKWADGRTCYNRKAVPGRTIATDPHVLPHHRWYYLQGIGWRCAEDRGGKIRGWHVDVLFKSVREARKFGRRTLIVRW